jgi:hypothetical protein
VNSAQRPRTASTPFTFSASAPSVVRLSANNTLHIASRNAASVPGVIARCSSACLAVRVRRGSIATRWAPTALAAWTYFQMWWPLVSVFVPHSRIRRDSEKVSGSMPVAVPLVYAAPTRPAIEQIVGSWREAPSTFHSREPARPSRPCR